MMTKLALSTLGPVERLARDEITVLVPDCRAALKWFIEHRDWDGAVRVATFGISNSRREEQELTDLLVHAIHTSREHPVVLAELRSTEQDLTLPSAAYNKLALDDIRAGWRPPVDRFSYAPHFYLENFGVSDRERDPGLLEALANSHGTFDAAPLSARAFAEWWVIRSLAMHGAAGAAHDRLAELDELAERLRSTTARSYASEARGQLALIEQSWSVAAEWFTDALTSNPPDHGGLFEIVTAWHRLAALALSGQPILGQDLRTPWRWLAECNLLTHREFGACTSAIALTYLGHRDLGQRFWWWAAQNTAGVLADEAARFPSDSSDFGPPPDKPIELTQLVEELFAFADRLP